MHVIQKTIGDVVSSGGAPVVPPTATIDAAITALRKSSKAAVVVCDSDNRVLGIFTERDLIRRVAAANRDLNTAVSEVMTPQPKSLSLTDCVTYGINLMAVHGFSNIPVLGDDGRLCALLGVRDVMAHLHDVLAELQTNDNDTDDDDPDWIDHGGG